MGSFFLLDEPAADELQRGAGLGEVDELAGIHQGRAADAHVHLLGPVLVEVADVVAQLGAADYGVVAEDGTVVVEDGAVGDELHLGHQIASDCVFPDWSG